MYHGVLFYDDFKSEYFDPLIFQKLDDSVIFLDLSNYEYLLNKGGSFYAVEKLEGFFEEEKTPEIAVEFASGLYNWVHYPFFREDERVPEKSEGGGVDTGKRYTAVRSRRLGEVDMESDR